MAQFDYDLITIGAGSGGVRASRLAGGYGARSAVVEADRVGGTCVLRGCIPKKLLIYGAHYAAQFEDAVNYGWTVEGARHDWATLIKNKNTELDRLHGIYLSILRNNKVELHQGRGVLTDPHTVEVNGKRITGANILIAVGGWPSLPKIPGIEHAITSNEALELSKRPQRIAIVGAGYIAVEFAGIFEGLGSEVTLIVRSQLLRGFDDDISAALAGEMAKRHVNVKQGVEVSAIAKQGELLTLTLTNGDKLTVDCVMYATGRHPNTQNLGLEAAGVKTKENGAIIVDEWQRTNVSHIYAVGDVTDKLQLTPVAIAEGRAVSETLFNNNPIKADHENVPTAVFSTPPISTVGLTEAQARKKYGKLDVYESRFKPLIHTLSGRDERTYMKIIVDAKTDKVVGCHMMGADAPEIIQGIAIAIKCGATKAQFDATVGIHPSAAEEFVTMRTKRPEKETGPEAKAAE
jgi:glutathione reductase (NADPH)